MNSIETAASSIHFYEVRRMEQLQMCENLPHPLLFQPNIVLSNYWLQLQSALPDFLQKFYKAFPEIMMHAFLLNFFVCFLLFQQFQ